MSAGARIVGGSIDLLESNADVAPVGTTRLRRKGGALQQSTDGAAFAAVGGGGNGNAWLTARVNALTTLYPSVMSGLNFIYTKPTNLNQATSAATPTIGARDAAIIGGAMSPAANQYLTCTGVILTDMTTQPHAWFARGKFAAPSANYQSMGPSGANDLVVFTSYAPYHATKLTVDFFVGGGGSNQVVTSHTIDGLIRNWGMLFDGTTYRFFVDDVEVGSSANLANVRSGSRVWAIFNVTAGDVNVSELAYGYQIP